MPLQHVQNIAAILTLHLAPHDHVTTALLHLHWLPVQYRIFYNLCLHKCTSFRIHKAPSYFADIATPTASVSSRGWLRSASSYRYEQPRTQICSALFLMCCTSRLEHCRHHCNNSLKWQLKLFFFNEPFHNLDE